MILIKSKYLIAKRRGFLLSRFIIPRCKLLIVHKHIDGTFLTVATEPFTEKTAIKRVREILEKYIGQQTTNELKKRIENELELVLGQGNVKLEYNIP